MRFAFEIVCEKSASMFCGLYLVVANRLHEKALSSFEELLSKNGSIINHKRNPRVLDVIMFKINKYIQNTRPGQAVKLISTRVMKLSTQRGHIIIHTPELH